MRMWKVLAPTLHVNLNFKIDYNIYLCLYIYISRASVPVRGARCMVGARFRGKGELGQGSMTPLNIEKRLEKIKFEKILI